MLKIGKSKLLISGIVFAGAFGFGASQAQAWNSARSASSSTRLESRTQADRVLSRTRFGDTDYCHLRFHAISQKTLNTSHPALQGDPSGDIVDFYGPCDHDPLGRDEVLKQRQDYAEIYPRP